MKKKQLTQAQRIYMRNEREIFTSCKTCFELKPGTAFKTGSAGVCTLCKSIEYKTDQEAHDRKNRVIFDAEIRRANNEYEWPTDREMGL